KHRVIPIAADGRTITLATSDPRDVGLEDTLRFVTGRRVSLEVAAPDAIEQRIDEAYRPERAINRLLQGLSTSNVETMDEVSVAAAAAVRDPALEAPMTKLVDAMISDGVREGASDIHAE